MTMNGKIFNDSVHGHMSFEPLLVKIIDTPEFQRLRNIKQLGFGYLVYPSASHNRFEHCLGTCHMARMYLEALEQSSLLRDETFKPTDQEKLCVLVAALCHDIGHGPFSHTWEKFITKTKKSWRHEKSSIEILDIILNREEVAAMMGKMGLDHSHVRLIKDLIDVPDSIQGGKKYFLYQIVSNRENDIDVDKFDYILRDQKQVNIQNSFDPQRLMRFCQVLNVRRGNLKNDRTEICFRDKETTNIIDMLQARAVLHDRAYQHKVVQIIENMFIDALLLANEAMPEWKLTNTSVEHLLTLTDKVYQDILYSKDPRLAAAQKLVLRIETRKLYGLKYIHKCEDGDTRFDNFTAVADEIYSELCNNNEGNLKREDFEVIAVKIDMGSKYKGGAINCYQFKKDSTVPEKMHCSANLFSDNIKPTLKKVLYVLYKGELGEGQKLNVDVIKDYFNVRPIVTVESNGTLKRKAKATTSKSKAIKTEIKIEKIE